MPFPPRILCALFGVLLCSSCSTLHKDGGKPFVERDGKASIPALQMAIRDVFGREGFTTGAPFSNPVVYQRPVRGADAIAYKDFFMETETIDRVTIHFLPKAAGHTRMSMNFQIVSRPGTMFESNKYPVLGSRVRYSAMLGRVAEAAESQALATDASGLPMRMDAPAWGIGGRY